MALSTDTRVSPTTDAPVVLLPGEDPYAAERAVPVTHRVIGLFDETLWWMRGSLCPQHGAFSIPGCTGCPPYLTESFIDTAYRPRAH